MRPSSRRSDTILRSIASRLNGTLTPWSRTHSVALFRYPASENVKSPALLVGFGNLRTSHGAESYITPHPTESRRMWRHAACFGRSAEAPLRILAARGLDRPITCDGRGRRAAGAPPPPVPPVAAQTAAG